MVQRDRQTISTLAAFCCLFAWGCAGTHGETETPAPESQPSRFDPTTPTGGIDEPGREPVVEPMPTMQHVSFEEGESAGPAEHVRGAPERPDIPSFQLFGTRGEGPG